LAGFSRVRFDRKIANRSGDPGHADDDEAKLRNWVEIVFDCFHILPAVGEKMERQTVRSGVSFSFSRLLLEVREIGRPANWEIGKVGRFTSAGGLK
jgi:hypothetical protein